MCVKLHFDWRSCSVKVNGTKMWWNSVLLFILILGIKLQQIALNFPVRCTVHALWSPTEPIKSDQFRWVGVWNSIRISHSTAMTRRKNANFLSTKLMNALVVSVRIHNNVLIKENTGKWSKPDIVFTFCSCFQVQRHFTMNLDFFSDGFKVRLKVNWIGQN